jgi:integrase
MKRRSESTRRNYAGAWRQFCKWAEREGHGTLPATAEAIEAYLTHRQNSGRASGTLKADRAAIHRYHEADDKPIPPDTAVVRRLLRGTTSRQDTKSTQPEVTGLTSEGLAKIRRTATIPRRGRSGRLEPKDVARARGLVDIALASTMRDGLLRRSEAAELRWGAITFEPDGTGRLVTDQRAQQYLSPATVQALQAIRPNGRRVPDDARVFNLRSGRSIANRIRAAALSAGLDGHFAGSSPRIGMAEDLDRAGRKPVGLQVIRRWHDALLPESVAMDYYGQDS